MVTYKITLENGESQTTQTGKDLYCSILDKFNIKYTIEEINSNDIPHSDIRRMESEGVYEEKFSDENSSSDSYEHSEHYWDVDRNRQPDVYFNEEWNQSNQSNTGDVEITYVYEPNKPL